MYKKNILLMSHSGDTYESHAWKLRCVRFHIKFLIKPKYVCLNRDLHICVGITVMDCVTHCDNTAMMAVVVWKRLVWDR